MRETLSARIDLTESRLKPYEGFVFLCGGPTDVRSPRPVSIRDAIYRELAKDPGIEARIRVAEHYKDWAHDSIYRDLVSFERHLAELSSVIVLVLESPGSIAELGLFSVIKEFQSKLLVVVETDHYTSPSFIKLGPINYLEKVHNNFAECHRWTVDVGSEKKFDPSAAIDLQSELAEAIQKRIRMTPPERLFNARSWLDQALFLCDLVNFDSALTLREIRRLLEDFGISRSESDIKQTLYLLERVSLVSMEPKGDQRFYVSIDSRQFFKYHLRDDSLDLSRYRSDRLAYYEREDKKRFRAILEVRRRNAPRG